MNVYYDEFCIDCTDCLDIQVHTTKTGRDCKVSFPCCNIIFSLLFCFNVFIDCSGDFDLYVVFFLNLLLVDWASIFDAIVVSDVARYRNQLRP